jgi:DNA polymerase III epsilon subunit-like protein
MSEKSPRVRDVTITVLDFETTGAVRGWPVEPWQIGLVRLNHGKVEKDGFLSHFLHVSAERPFNPRAPGRHARLRDELAVAPDLATLWPELTPWLVGLPLAAHNIGTERTVLERAAPLHRLGPWIDTLRLVRKFCPQLASASLTDVVAELGLVPRLQTFCPNREPHDALYDAFACALLLEHFLAQPGWEDVTVRALKDLR